MRARNHRLALISATVLLAVGLACIALRDSKQNRDSLSGSSEFLHMDDAAANSAGPEVIQARNSGTAELRALQLFSPVGHASAPVARPLASALNPQTFKGRTLVLNRAKAAVFQSLKPGASVILPGFDEDASEVGVVNLGVEDGGWLRFGGRLKNGSGTFSLHLCSDQVFGTILFPETEMALEIRTEPSGEVFLVERLLSQIICAPAAPRDPDVSATLSETAATASSPDVVPQINTRPGAKGLIYLHFTGGDIQDVDWNGGVAVQAERSGLNAAGILEVVARVAEDYAPFDVAISTIPSDYEAAQPGRRMRVIITPTSTVLPRSGGVSLLRSWAESGKGRSSTVPAWVFNSSAKGVAEAVSHEVGHTFGLSHDGTIVEAYYRGNGGDLKSPTSWAPIMGTSYDRSLTQWSKGDYPFANNTQEDDIAVIASDKNAIGYRAPSLGPDTDAGGGSRLLNVIGGTFMLNGVLKTAASPDRFKFSTAGGAFSINAKPADPKVTNVDLELELVDEAGATLAISNPPNILEATISRDALPAGAYQLLVRPAPNVSPDTGEVPRYPAYGSLGAYVLSGALENAVPLPEILSPPTVYGALGRSFSHHVLLSRGSRVSEVVGALPPGVFWNAAEGSFTGNPSELGIFNVTLNLSSDSGTLTRAMRLIIETPSLPLPLIDGVLGSVWTSPTVPWIGQTMVTPDNTTNVAAASGRIPDRSSSKMLFRIPARRTVSFSWKVSSEAAHDFLECRVNGALARDADTGALLRISGETGWATHRVNLDFPAPAMIEFSYTKDATLSEGSDRAWVAGIEVGVLPFIKRHPISQRLKKTDTSLTLEAQVENATSYQWKKNGVPLSDGTLGLHSISGASTNRLFIEGVEAADSGAYLLEASNAFSKVSSRRADVSVPQPPVVLQELVPPANLRSGDTLILSVQTGGASPQITTWFKDGRFLKRTSGTVLQVPRITPDQSGVYSFSVSNFFGSTQPKAITVQIAPAGQ